MYALLISVRISIGSRPLELHLSEQECKSFLARNRINFGGVSSKSIRRSMLYTFVPKPLQIEIERRNIVMV